MSTEITGFDFSELELFPELGGDVEVIDPNADMDSVVTPPEGQKYVVVPSLVGMKGNEKLTVKTNKNSKLQFVGVNWKIKDEGKPWNGQSTRTWPSVAINRAQTTEVDLLLRAYTGAAGVGMTDKAKISKLGPILQAGTPIKVEIQWEAQLGVEGEAEDIDSKEKINYRVVLRGMNKFPMVEGIGHTAITSVDQLPESAQKQVTTLAENYLAKYGQVADISVTTSFRIKNYYPMSVA